jgi:hypothetical protein
MTTTEEARTPGHPFGAPTFDPASEIATQVMNLPWTRHGITFAPGVDFDDDALGDRHGEVQAIADKVIREAPALAAPRADSAERTAGGRLPILTAPKDGTPVVTSLAPLHTYPIKSRFEGGRWVFHSPGQSGDGIPYEPQPSHWTPIATPAPSSPGVPDSVRALSEAATQVEAKAIRYPDSEGGAYVTVDNIQIASGLDEDDADFVVAAFNYVRDLISKDRGNA